MTAIFVGVISCYLLAMLAVYILGRAGRRREMTIAHYILIGGDEAQGLEWHIRRIRWRAFWSGIPARMTVVGEGEASCSSLIASKLLGPEDRIVRVAASGQWRVLRCEGGRLAGEEPLPTQPASHRRRAVGAQPGRPDGSADPADREPTRPDGPRGVDRPGDVEDYLFWLRTRGVTAPGERTVVIDLRRVRAQSRG